MSINPERRIFSGSLQKMLNLKLLWDPQSQHKKKKEKLQTQPHQRLKESLDKFATTRRRYEGEIDKVVDKLAQQHQMNLQLPSLKHLKTYRNYRIKTERSHGQEHESPQSTQRDSNPQQTPRKARISTEPRHQVLKRLEKELDLQGKAEDCAKVVQHYRLKSLKQTELNVDLDRLRKWRQRQQYFTAQHETQKQSQRRIQRPRIKRSR